MSAFMAGFGVFSVMLLVGPAHSVPSHGAIIMATVPMTATAFLNFVPVSALLLSITLGKPPAANEVVGMAMVIVALLVHTATSGSGYLPPAKPMAIRPNHNPCGVTP